MSSARHSVISFGIPSIHIVFPFLMPVFVCFRIFMINGINANGYKTANHPFIIIMFMFTGEIFSGILEVFSLISQITKKKVTTERKTRNTSQFLKRLVIQKKVTSRFSFNYLLVCLAALIDFINMTGLMLLPGQSTEQQNQILEWEMKIIQIIFTSVLSYLILKVKVYRHQYLSIAMIFIGLILLMVGQKVDNYFAIPFYLLFFCSSSVQEVIEKWTIEIKDISTFRILFIEGLCGISLCTLAIFISSYIPCQWDFCSKNNHNMVESFYEGFGSLCTVSNALYVLGYVIGSFCLNNSTMLTSKHFTATHRTVSDSLASFIWGIISLIQGTTRVNLFIQILAYGIITLGCLIYNEIMILFCCKLGENTKREIERRESSESAYLEIEFRTINKDLKSLSGVQYSE